MFKVGMGETPEIPDSLSEEGQDFIESCIQYNPKNRPTSIQLKHHTFLKVKMPLNLRVWLQHPTDADTSSGYA